MNEKADGSKLLVVGWDGATFDLLGPWIETGELPNLARLMQEGVHGRLRSVPNMNSGPAWTTVSTGHNEGQHGIYGLVDFVQDSYRLRPLNATDRHTPTIWQRMSRAGYRLIVVNLPMMYPAEPVNGFVIAGGDAPGTNSPGVTYPDGLMAEIIDQVGDYIVADRIDGLVRAGETAKALSRLERMIELRTSAMLYLMEKQPWHLAMVMFTASDSVQHYFWKTRDEQGQQAVLLKVFRHLDNSLGRLIAQAGQDTTTILLSDHGFGEYQCTSEFLNGFLAELGLLHYKQRSKSQTSVLRWVLSQVERALGEKLKARLLERFPRLRGARSIWLGDIDWSRTRAFNLAGSSHIWINVQGQYPEGIVLPGDEYEQVMALIEEALIQAVDPKTAKPAVKAVHRRTDLYHGPLQDKAPDLLVEWVDEFARSGLAWRGDQRKAVTSRRVAYRPYLINGGHRKMGIFVARGKPFRADKVIEHATLYDIAPTLLYLLDQPIPASFDGKVLQMALKDTWLHTHPPQYISDDMDEFSGPSQSLNHEDQDTVMQRLRALGYVE